MSKHQGIALYQAVCASPDDEAVRLVLADWLDEFGTPADAARAELLRLQCRLSALIRSPEDWPTTLEWRKGKDWPTTLERQQGPAQLGARVEQLVSLMVERRDVSGHPRIEAARQGDEAGQLRSRYDPFNRHVATSSTHVPSFAGVRRHRDGRVVVAGEMTRIEG